MATPQSLTVTPQEILDAKGAVKSNRNVLEAATGKLVGDALWNSGMEMYPGGKWVEKIRDDPELVELLEFAGTLGCRFGISLKQEAENGEASVTGLNISSRSFVEVVDEVRSQIA